MQHNQQFQLGNWIVCAKTNTIENSDHQKSLDNKSMQVLLFLIQHAGQSVTKEQIIQHVWKESVVNEEILSVAISKIRKALGDNARKPTYIKTLPNLGYSLIAGVTAINGLEQEQQVLSNVLGFKRSGRLYYTLAATLLLIIIVFAVHFVSSDNKPEQIIAIDSIAVLPFKDLSAAQNNHFFTDGLSDAIINQLSQTKSLKVISRYSSFNFRGNRDPFTIGNALKVEALLDGSVQESEGQIRINVRIFSTFDGRQLWSKSFDSTSEDVFYLQDQISDDIQRAIQPNAKALARTSKKINSQAYEWFLMAKYHWQQRTPTALSKAETYLKHSLELEPNYADAHVGLATTYGHYHYYANWSDVEAVNKALPHIEQALALEPESPAALAVKGMILTLKSNYTPNPQPILQEAQRAFKRSLEIEDSATTHHWYSVLLKRIGEEALVIKHMERAISLNPLSAPLKRIYSRYLALRGKLDTAQKMYHRALLLEPGRDSNLIESTFVMRNTPNLVVDLAQWHSNHSELFEYCSSDAYCEQAVFSYLSVGQRAEADKILARMPAKHQHFKDSLALIDHGLKGLENHAVVLLEQLSAKHPHNHKYRYSLAIALFRAGLYRQAKTAIVNLYPDWSNTTLGDPIEVTSDNYSAMVLYGASLLKLKEQELASLILNSVREFLSLNEVQDKAQIELTLAEVNALLGYTDRAVKHLSKALNHGWLETFDREWWPLQDNHLFKSINTHPDFISLVKEHHTRLAKLSEQISEELAPL
ncbi:winged helix-turn-helix domain-containing protein [Planctobacterium marinum]|uniref:OmpR/PhoB-type domain-containing protein n=1 Tax=Planctobacterium marinum TaxID=1631968 RepID=A0AA48HJR6_9ALTE|nr:hypothetical protein MACH26_36590 [Planctobacterium marinum]